MTIFRKMQFTQRSHNMGVYQSSPSLVVILPARIDDFPNSADFTDDPEPLVENIAWLSLVERN
jgi:hypothetical protein